MIVCFSWVFFLIKQKRSVNSLKILEVTSVPSHSESMKMQIFFISNVELLHTEHLPLH